MGLGLFNPGCNCRIKAERALESGYGEPCRIRIEWCTLGDLPTLQIGSGPQNSVSNSGVEWTAEAGPYVLRSTMCGENITCSAPTVALCSYRYRRLQISIPSSSRSINNPGTCGSVVVSNIYDTVSGTDVNAILDFDYNQNCNAVITPFPLEIDLGAWTVTSGASGTESGTPWSAAVSETFNLTYRYDRVFPNGAHCPTYPIAMDHFVYDDYDFTINLTGSKASIENQVGCSNFTWGCTVDSTNSDQRVRKTRMPVCLPSDITGTVGGGVNPFANGYPITNSNSRYCSTCGRASDDTTVPVNTIYLNRLLIGSYSWSNTPC